MHNHVGHRWIKTFLRKIISILLVYSLFFTNTANASTLAGGSGWRVASTVSNGIGVTVNGVKDVMVNGAKKTVTGVANVTPTASQVGKFIGKNAGAAAVVGAVDLLLDGVDWVLDPANNQIVYNNPSDPTVPDPTKRFCYTTVGDCTADAFLAGNAANTANDICKSIYKKQQRTYGQSNVEDRGCTTSGTTATQKTFYKPGGTVMTTTAGQSANPVYDPTAEEQEEQKTIPLANLGQRVLDQAETEVKTGNPAVPIATPVTQAAAAAIVGEAATDDVQARPIVTELDKSAAIPTDETAVGEIAPPTTNPDTGEVKPGSISLDFPVFCSWAPSMCVLADKVQQAITDATVWAKNDENKDTDNEPPEIEEIDIDALDTSTFTGVAGCPAPIAVPITFGDGGETEISYEPICQLAEKWSFVAPLIGFLSGAMIIVGVGRKGEDGEI